MSAGKRIQSLYFSPTGTTRKILSTIEEHTGLPAASQNDLTLLTQRELFAGKVQGEIILVGVPVYGGTYPLLMMEPLNRLEGEGKWAVPVAVYGNRSAETCVDELAKLLRNKGFKILAAASFIGEHSYATKEHPWGLGRPDHRDLETAAKFGKQIREKLLSNPTEIRTSDRLLSLFTNKMVDSLTEQYHTKMADWLKGHFRIAFSEDANCTECMNCSNVCPTDAIKAELKEINDDVCIRCAACVHACPTGVLSVCGPPDHDKILDKACAVRKEPKIYI